MSNKRVKVGAVDMSSPFEKAYNAYGRALALKPGLAPPPTLTGAGDIDRPAIHRKRELRAFRKGLKGEPLKNSLEQIITNFLMEAKGIRIPDVAADVKYGEPSKSEKVATGTSMKDLDTAHAAEWKAEIQNPAAGIDWNDAYGAYGARRKELIMAVKQGIRRGISTGQPTDIANVKDLAKRLVGTTKRHRDTVATMVNTIRKYPFTKRAK